MPTKRFVKPGNRAYKKRSVSSGSGTYYSGDYESCRKRRPKPWLDDECENTVNINTNITVNQSNQANSSGGDGGNGGSASASTATAISTGDGDSSARTSSEIENKDEHSQNEVIQVSGPSGQPQPPGAMALEETGAEAQDAETLQDVDAISSESTAAGGAGGAGGGGGALEATQSNSSSITVENYNCVILCCNGEYPPPSTTLSLNGNSRTLDIRVDNGETYINGQKLDEKTMPNGTKVMIFHSSENSTQTSDNSGEVNVAGEDDI